MYELTRQAKSNPDDFKEAVLAAFTESKGNTQEAANILKVPYRTLYNAIRLVPGFIDEVKKHVADLGYTVTKSAYEQSMINRGFDPKNHTKKVHSKVMGRPKKQTENAE